MKYEGIRGDTRRYEESSLCPRRCKEIPGVIKKKQKYEKIGRDTRRCDEIRIDVLDTTSFPLLLNRYKCVAIRGDTGRGEEIRGIS